MRHLTAPGRWPLLLLACPFAFYMACAATDGSVFKDDDGGPGHASAGGAGGGDAAETTGSGFDPVTSGGPSNDCNTAFNVDDDLDGFTEDEGDCNDCDANVSPGAIEVQTPMAQGTGGAGGGMQQDPADENCDGTVDEVILPCDNNLAFNDQTAVSAAKSIGLCQQTTAAEKTFGVVNASWVRANGTPTTPTYNANIQADWGPNVPVREGGRMLVLSSGHALLPNQPNNCGTLSCSTSGAGTPPPNFPANVPNCPGGTNINDDIALEVQLRAPTNATGYSFDFTFYSFEFPEWVCTTYNDQFIALVTPPPMGAIDGNICFDAMNNPVSVNIAFFEVCNYNPSYPQFPCALGPGELSGTGFDSWNDAGATSWLVTTAPISGGDEFSIRFAIWDTGDQAWDSTVVIDNFRWIANTGTNVTVGTTPVPE